MDRRAKALEKLINDTPVKLGKGRYIWHDLIYEVKPYSEIKKRGKSGGNITKYIYVTYAGVKYGIWELTPNMVQKLGLDN